METRLIPVMHKNYRSRHLSDTSWCLVRFVSVEAGSAVNWSITRKQYAMRIKRGIILEISTKKPKHYPHQKPAPTRRSSDQHWNKRDLSWQCGILKEEPNVSLQSPSSVKSGSRSQPQLKNPHGQISQASPH